MLCIDSHGFSACDSNSREVLFYLSKFDWGSPVAAIRGKRTPRYHRVSEFLTQVVDQRPNSNFFNEKAVCQSLNLCLELYINLFLIEAFVLNKYSTNLAPLPPSFLEEPLLGDQDNPMIKSKN